jgi:uncharacterized membrane protein/Mg-chelatase subunit ChlD
MDRLFVYLVALSPLLVMLAVLFYSRSKRVPASRLRGELIYTGVFLAAVGGFIAWDVLRTKTGAVNHVYLKYPWVLAFLPLVYVVLLVVQHRTLSGISRGRMWTAFLLRSAIMILILLALAGVQMVLESDTLRVMFVLDVSKSVPLDEQRKAVEFIRESLSEKKPDDEAGLVVFGNTAALERSPSNLLSSPDPEKFKSQTQPDATNIARALQAAVGHFRDDARKRLVLFTDGRQTSGEAAEELSRIVSQGVDVWIVPLNSGDHPEILVENVQLNNQQLLWQQPFTADVYVRSNVTAKVRVSLYKGDKAGGDPAPKIVTVTPGINRVSFTGLRMATGGGKEVKAIIEPLDEGSDLLSENNEAYTFVDVLTDNRILVLTSDLKEVQLLQETLETEKLTLDIRTGATLPSNPEDYRAYDCIILANLPRDWLSDQQMAVIESCVKDQGAGLIMIGGDKSFGAGGYLHTPIERALPVNMDVQNTRVMPSGALCIVLHTCEFPDGNAWGKKISKAAIQTLSPQDYAGLLYFDQAAGEQWAFQMSPVSNKRSMFDKIDSTNPGDMPTLDPIVAMAVQNVQKLSNVGLKHCIIITDGDPQPPSATTIAAARAAKISISVITIFPHGSMDTPAMQKLANDTGGSYYRLDQPGDAKKLPQIFIKEAAVVRKNLIHEKDEGIPVNFESATNLLKDFSSDFPKVKGFVVTQAKNSPQVVMNLYSVVEGEKVPVLMSWKYGLGKAVAFTSDATNHWAPTWVEWSSYKKFWTNVLTWSSRQRMPANHTVQTLIDGNIARVIVEGVTAKGDYQNFDKLTGNAIDPDVSKPGKEGTTYPLTFEMKGPGRYEATFPVDKVGAYAVTIIDQSNPAAPSTIVAGLANSYSKEFLHLESDQGLLEKLGTIAQRNTELSHMIDLATVNAKKSGLYSHDLPPARQPMDLFWRLLLIALCLFPLDIAVRRLALDPEHLWAWLGKKFGPLLGKLGMKKRQLQEAAVEAIAGKPGAQSEVVPSGPNSRAAQSRYEQAGDSAQAQNMDLVPGDKPENKAPVGGTKLTPVDDAASDYTRALLKAKKRAKKD